MKILTPELIGALVLFGLVFVISAAAIFAIFFSKFPTNKSSGVAGLVLSVVLFAVLIFFITDKIQPF